MRTSTIWKVLVFALALQAVAMRMSAEAAISCSTVISDVVPCLSYVAGSAASPTAGCCNGVKALNAAAQTTPDRQAACKCIKSAAASYKYNSDKAGKIPGLCGVNIGFPISASTNCNAIR